MKRVIDCEVLTRLATLGANTLRWFRESDWLAGAAGIDWTVKDMDATVATFRSGQVEQEVTWAGLVMLVRMGWAAEDKRVDPETFSAQWQTATGEPCEPWDAKQLEISCEPKTKPKKET